MKTVLRMLGAFLLTALMVVSLGAAPGQALGNAVAESNLLAIDVQLGGLSPSTTDFDVTDRLSLDSGYIGPDAGMFQAFQVNPSERLEVIIGLEGRSLAAEQAYREANGLPLLGAQEQMDYVADLRARQADLRAALEAAGAPILYDYQIVYNGLATVIDAQKLEDLGGVRGIRSIAASKPIELALEASVPFILGGQTWTDLGVTGAGVTIAVIDTGIDYYHAGLGGSGNPADYAADNATIIEMGTFPTAKVVFGYDLVGENYHAGCPAINDPTVCSSIPFPDPDPLDLQGHGSHVSGIAAGIGTAFVSPGVAPDALLYALKVFALGSASTSVIMAGIEMAVDPNGDGSTDDKADVINMSLGSPYSRNTEPLAVASNAAVDLGTIVVASAGNEGNLPYVTGGPSVADKAISVAAMNDPGTRLPGVHFEPDAGGAFDYVGSPALFGASLETAVTGPAFDVAGTACAAIGSDLTGTIALINRGTCTFVTKARNAQTAGAVAAIIINNQAGLTTMADDGTGGDIVIPLVMILQTDGAELRANMPGTATVGQVDVPDNNLAGFTSRGPRFGDSYLKPDVSAPGVVIESVLVGSGDKGFSISGTSMSSPHVAGAAALLREAHPWWSPEKIKAALMNTATDALVNGSPYPLSHMGAGRIQVDQALETTSLVTPASASFGLVEEDWRGKKVYKEKLKLRNMDHSWRVFTLDTEFLFAADDEGSIEVSHPSYLVLRPHQSKSFKLRIVVDFDMLAPESPVEEYELFLTLTEVWPGDDVLRVPIHIVPYARARADAWPNKVKLPYNDEFKVRNRGLADTYVDIYQFGVKDGNEDLISEGLFMPNDPDNWFDIYLTGAHAWDLGVWRIVEFATVTHGIRSVANLMLAEIYIDVDEDGTTDYLVQALDYGFFTGNYPDGRIVSGVFDAITGSGFLQFFVFDQMNTAIQTIPIFLDDMNFLGSIFGRPIIDAANPDFDYLAVNWDLETGAFDFTNSASFNPLTPALDGSPQFFYLPVGGWQNVQVLGNEKGKLLVLYYNNEAGHDQAELVKVQLKHHCWH